MCQIRLYNQKISEQSKIETDFSVRFRFWNQNFQLLKKIENSINRFSVRSVFSVFDFSVFYFHPYWRCSSPRAHSLQALHQNQNRIEVPLVDARHKKWEGTYHDPSPRATTSLLDIFKRKSINLKIWYKDARMHFFIIYFVLYNAEHNFKSTSLHIVFLIYTKPT